MQKKIPYKREKKVLDSVTQKGDNNMGLQTTNDAVKIYWAAMTQKR